MYCTYSTVYSCLVNKALIQSNPRKRKQKFQSNQITKVQKVGRYVGTHTYEYGWPVADYPTEQSRRATYLAR